MKIGFCFDHSEDYGFSSNDLTYCDFISPTAVTFVKRTLEKCGYEVKLIGNHIDFQLLIQRGFDCDLVLSATEGIQSRNRESWISSIAEMNKIPYIGTDAYGTIVTLDKVLTKLIATYIGISTPNFVELNCLEQIDDVKQLGYPLIIKPNYEGSSMGVVMINDDIQLKEQCQQLLDKYSQKLLAEQYISGKEITVSIYEKNGVPTVFGMVESLQNNGEIMPIYSSEIKRIFGCKKILPRISQSIKNRIVDESLRLYSYLGCKDYCRIDFRLDRDEKPFLLEVTPLPALAETASFMMAAKLNNISSTEIFKTIIDNACNRYNLFPKS